ncbi:hypothetical protein HKCCE2091_17930 [Rhodobacterales bacterium HKCCE2091]|nr:hypothetical protein [Rhodobacterales bacterium HKCCE2091]
MANAFLFAQQAADRRIEAKPDAGSAEWYAAYTDVLGRIGWTVEDRSATTRAFKGSAGSVHRAILPVVTAALVPVAGVAPLVVQVLQGLQEMDADRPWMTLFARTSRRARANQFQVAHVRGGSAPTIRIVAFDLDARQSQTQVLFFRFASAEADLSHFETGLSVNGPVFAAAAPVMRDRLADRVARYVAEIEI